MKHIEDMSKRELLAYLNGFIKAMVEDGWDCSQGSETFFQLHKRIVAELSRQRLYKVSTINASETACGEVREYNIRYFASLKAAKRELHARFNQQRKHPLIAAPEEIQELGVQASIHPSLAKSTLSNQDISLKAPGRFKFYEVRMIRDPGDPVSSIQFVMTSIEATIEPMGKKDSHLTPKIDHSKSVIQFNTLKKK